MNGNGHQRLALPNQVNIGCQAVPGPMMMPVSVALPNGAGGATVTAFGGMTTIEYMATHLLGQMAFKSDPSDPAFNTRWAVEQAYLLKSECDRRAAEASKPPVQS